MLYLCKYQLLAHPGQCFATVAAMLLQRGPVPATCPCTLATLLGSGCHTLPYVAQESCRRSVALDWAAFLPMIEGTADVQYPSGTEQKGSQYLQELLLLVPAAFVSPGSAAVLQQRCSLSRPMSRRERPPVPAIRGCDTQASGEG